MGFSPLKPQRPWDSSVNPSYLRHGARHGVNPRAVEMLISPYFTTPMRTNTFRTTRPHQVLYEEKGGKITRMWIKSGAQTGAELVVFRSVFGTRWSSRSITVTATVCRFYWITYFLRSIRFTRNGLGLNLSVLV